MAQKTVLITGTSTGIGAACVARQAAAGWKVYAGVRKVEDGERLVETLDGDIVPVRSIDELPRYPLGLNWALADDPSQRLFW